MTSNPYLQHLIADPTFGYLFPHRLTIAAFGVANDYHLRKHYPRLVEGQHYIKIRGSDHVERMFYTLVGLLALSDLVNTPQAQAFKQALIAQTQPGGAMVQAQPAALYQPPVQPVAPLYAAPLPTAIQPETVLSDLPIPQPAYLADRVAPSRQPQLEPALERSIARFSTPAPMPYQTPQETAALIFEAQRVASEQAQQTAQTLLQAQRLVAEQRPTELHLSINLWKRWDHWLSQQDTWAIALIVASLMALGGISSYFLVSAIVRPAPTLYPSTSTGR